MFTKKIEIKKIGRLKKRSDFLRIQQARQKWVAKGLVVEIAQSAFEKPHYGITVSKKASKSAVVRNRIKRRLRSIVLDVLPNYADQQFDIVVIGRAEAATREYDDLKQDLLWCLKKLGYKSGSSA